jgi:hypothetical protein
MIPREAPLPSLLRLIARWVPDLDDRHRVPEREIPDFVPAPLRELYSFAGNYPVHFSKQWQHPDWVYGLFGPQDQLLPIDQLKLTGSRIRFMHENQGVWWCETDANALDPPVYSDATAYEHGNPEGTMIEVCPSLSHFLTTYCLQEITFGSKRLLSIDSEIKSPRDAVTAAVNDIWIKGRYVYEQPTHSFYIVDDVLMIMNTCGSYWFAYNDDRALKLIAPNVETRVIH